MEIKKFTLIEIEKNLKKIIKIITAIKEIETYFEEAKQFCKEALVNA